MSGTNEATPQRVANAMFLAVGPPEATEEPNTASGPEFQHFVEESWANQDPVGTGPTDEDMAEMATNAGMPTDVADKIGDGEDAANVDIERWLLPTSGSCSVDPITTGTPTVYDLDTTRRSTSTTTTGSTS